MFRKGRMLAVMFMAALCSVSLLTAVACGETENGKEPSQGTATYTLSYVSGAEDATGDPVEETYAEGAAVKLKGADVFTRTGYTFDKWSDGSATYAAGASFTMPAHDVTLTATWAETEKLPDGTEEVTSVPEGLLTTENGTATAVWSAEYTEDGVKVTAWVTDSKIYAENSNLYQNDGIEVIVAKAERAVDFTEHTIAVSVDAAGHTEAKNLGSDETLDAGAVTAEAKYFTLDKQTVAGYHIIVTVPNALTGVDKSAQDAVLALGFTNASNAANGVTEYDSTYGTERDHVHTYMTFKNGAFAANPDVEMGFWGDAGALKAASGWDLSHDDDTENAYIELTSSDGDNYVYIKNSQATTVYAEMEIQAPGMFQADGFPKFGISLTKSNGNDRFFYFVDAVTEEPDRLTFKSDSVNLAYVYRGTKSDGTVDWLWPETTVGKVGESSEVYTKGYVKLGMYRQGQYVLLTLNGEPVGDPILLQGFGKDELTWIGLVSFNIRLNVKNYTCTTDETQLTEYKNIVDNYVPKISTKTLDGKLTDWTEEEKNNPFVFPSDNGRSVTVYAAMDTYGVNLFFDAYHREHKSTESDWFNNTNVEFRLGGDAGKQYAAAANGEVVNIQKSNCSFGTTPAEEDGLYHTTVEIFVPYGDIGSGYSQESEYVPAAFFFKIGGVFGNVWETGDWWRAGGAEEMGVLITRNGILGGTKKTIDGNLEDWADATWTTKDRYQWSALLEEDGLYLAVKAHAATIAADRMFVSGADGADGGAKWWLNQNLEIQKIADGASAESGLKAARVIYFNGAAYHTNYINDAAAKLTQNEGTDDELVFEIFIARANFVNPQTEEIKAWIGGQLFEDKENEDNHWQMALDGDTIKGEQSETPAATAGYIGAAAQFHYTQNRDGGAFIADEPFSEIAHEASDTSVKLNTGGQLCGSEFEEAWQAYPRPITINR